MSWVEQVIFQPERTESDRMDAGLEHRLGRISDYENRVLRVIVVKKSNPVRIVTAYFDRKMRDKL